LEFTNGLIEEGYDKEVVLDKAVNPHRETSNIATKKVIMPPIEGGGMGRRLIPDFANRLFRPNQTTPELWISPFLPRITNFCQSIGESPYYNR
ncbi:MAG: hypothetical protein QF489_00900, partial [Planctomycetota bacterium]|nr:hypothetical protein [Planctomycetota bacterium]